MLIKTTSFQVNVFVSGLCILLGLQFPLPLSGNIPSETHCPVSPFKKTAFYISPQDVIASISASMINVPSGSFKMGCTAEQGNECTKDEFPVHHVTLSTFRMMKTEITQAHWMAVMGINPAQNKRSDQFPVENVSFKDVELFIEKLNSLTGKSYRLPTEAEWEFASRGGRTSCGYMYSGSFDSSIAAWHGGNSSDKSHVVGLKQPNELGLFDMSGNVWEWCSDWYGPYNSAVQSDPRGPSSGSDHVVRGGSWAGAPWFCRSAIRYHYPPAFKSPFLGFRLVEDVL